MPGQHNVRTLIVHVFPPLPAPARLRVSTNVAVCRNSALQLLPASICMTTPALVLFCCPTPHGGGTARPPLQILGRLSVLSW